MNIMHNVILLSICPSEIVTIALALLGLMSAPRRLFGSGSSITSNVSCDSTKMSWMIVISAHAESPTDWPSVNVTSSAIGRKSKTGVATCT